MNWEVWHERKDPDSPDDRDEAFRRREGWLSVRVPMDEASDTVGLFKGDVTIVSHDS